MNKNNTQIIAEIGWNHMGKTSLAKKMSKNFKISAEIALEMIFD